jgi:hypothetical protein
MLQWQPHQHCSSVSSPEWRHPFQSVQPIQHELDPQWETNMEYPIINIVQQRTREQRSYLFGFCPLISREFSVCYSTLLSNANTVCSSVNLLGRETFEGLLYNIALLFYQIIMSTHHKLAHVFNPSAVDRPHPLKINGQWQGDSEDGWRSKGLGSFTLSQLCGSRRDLDSCLRSEQFCRQVLDEL